MELRGDRCKLVASRCGACLLLACCAWMASGSQRARPSAVADLYADACRRLERALRDSRFVTLGGPLPAWPDIAAKGYGSVPLPAEERKQDHGVYWMGTLGASIDVRDGYPAVTAGGTPEIRVAPPSSGPWSLTECRQLATDYAARHFDWFFLLGQIEGPFSRHGPRGVIDVRWEGADGLGRWSAALAISVRTFDGRVVGFSSSYSRNRPQPTGGRPRRLPLDRVLASAQAAVTARLGTAENRRLRVLNYELNLEGEGDEPFHPHYAVTLQVEPPWRGSSQAVVRLDERSGAPVTQIDWGPDRSERPPERLPTLSQPVWVDGRLAVFSDQPLADLPPWASSGGQVLLADDDGRLHYVTEDVRSRANRLVAVGPHHLAIRDWADPGWLLDVRTGASRSHFRDRLPIGSGSVSPDGRWLVAEGEDLAGGVELVTVELREGLDRIQRQGWVGIAGDEECPQFSPDGAWLYFIHWPLGPKGPVLCRLPAAMVRTTGWVKLPPGQPEVIAAVPREIARYGVFSSGRQALVDGLDGLFVVSAETKDCRELDLGGLVDPDLGRPVTVGDGGWPGPGEARVTFAGWVTDAAGGSHSRVYSCRLDGGDVQAHTPLDLGAAPMYVFPKTGKTAFELAQEWALAELAYERRSKPSTDRD